MDSDFHYYGTGTAALEAGYSQTDATLIANVAQYVDWFDSDYWSNWHIVNSKGQPVNDQTGKQYKYAYPQLSVQKIDFKMAVDYDANIWNPFHFPPGNLPYTNNGTGWAKAFNQNHAVRKTNLKPADANKLCRPFSKFALDMIVDTIGKYQELSTANSAKLASLIKDWVAPRSRCPATDGRKLALYLLGLRIHVLSDTWAHQDFTGEPNVKINGAGMLNNVFAKDAEGNWQKSTWTGTVWALNGDTDCAAAPVTGTDKTAAGHGQMGHYPDYSWLVFRYPAAWLPSDQSHLERNNPAEYEQAWRWISFAMALCNGNKGDGDLPEQVPQAYVDVMKTWHELSTKGLRAVAESEKLWRQTSGGQKIPTRWDPAERKPLGLYDGLAKTRFGYINVVQDSTLHLMELAAAMHYQFCVQWMAANPDYSWKPWQPKT